MLLSKVSYLGGYLTKDLCLESLRICSFSGEAHGRVSTTPYSAPNAFIPAQGSKGDRIPI